MPVKSQSMSPPELPRQPLGTGRPFAGVPMHDRPPPEFFSMSPPASGGAPGYGAATGGSGGTAGAPPMGKFGTLRVISGNDQGKVIELNRPVTTIGRGADQMLVLADIAVSRRHLQVHMTQTGYRLQDMGSPNGTMVNGKRVSEVQLMDGDQIEIGNSLMRFEHPPSRPQQEAPPQPPSQPVAPQMNYAPPNYGAPMQPGMQPMGYPPQGYPPQGAYPQSGMPMQPVAPAYQPPPAPMAPPPMAPPPMAPPPMALQSQAQPAMMSEPSGGVSRVPAGPLGALSHPQKRLIYFGALGGALLVGLVGLTVSLARSGSPQKAIDKAMELYVSGSKEFSAHRYDAARKAFEAALALAPDSQELKHYIEACDTEDKAYKLIEAAAKEFEEHKYVEALKQFGKVDKSSVQYEDAQQHARLARREAVKELISQVTATAKTDFAGALDKVNKGLEEIDPDNGELVELKTKLSSAPKPVEETQVAENTPPPEKAKPEPEVKSKAKPEPKKELKKEAKAPPPAPKQEPAAAGGDLASNKQALAAYKNRDFNGAISAIKAVKSPKTAATIKELDDLKAKTDQAVKLEGGNPSGALAAYQAAAAIDKRLGGGLAAFYSGKISALQSKAGGAKPPAALPGGAGKPPAAGGDAAKDGQADQLLVQAKGLATKNPTQARNLCRKVMQLYGNSPKNPKVQEAYRLLNSIKGGKDDDDDF